MLLAFRQASTVTTVFAFFLALVPGNSDADEYQYFRSIQGGSTGTAGWDRFQGSTYNGPHAADQGSTGFSSAVLSVDNNGGGAGFLTASQDLYSFFSTPIWQIGATGMDATLPFTSVALQVASTPDQAGGILDASDFLLNGNQADRFAVVGQFSLLSAGGGQPPQPVYYYFAAWDALAAGTSYSLAVGPPAQNHTVLAGARLDYVNTSDANFLINAVPEPASTILIAMFGAAMYSLRRRTRQ